MSKIARFNIGDCVIHKNHHYRAIIIDVDPLFQASGSYNPQAMKHEFATKNPWYRLLVDNRNQITYVQECMLITDPNHLSRDNPHLKTYLKKENGHYYPINSIH